MQTGGVCQACLPIEDADALDLRVLYRTIGGDWNLVACTAVCTKASTEMTQTAVDRTANANVAWRKRLPCIWNPLLAVQTGGRGTITDRTTTDG